MFRREYAMSDAKDLHIALAQGAAVLVASVSMRGVNRLQPGIPSSGSAN